LTTSAGTTRASRLALRKSASLAPLPRTALVLAILDSVVAMAVIMHQLFLSEQYWLLMSQDRAHSDQFSVTQEFMAYMLGARRSGISEAATLLQRDGLISYRRGEMTVLDRPGLEAVSCSCYLADLQCYARSLGSVSVRSRGTTTH
ncbi:MAG: helix-turn-helix domain-containing protein, partial [Variovorax sp.]